MIIVRSPLRITLGGGNSDSPACYTKHGGFTVCAAIDKYVYVTVTRPFFKGIFLKYSQMEHVEQVADVKHPTIREVLRDYAEDHPQIEITSLTDIPAGTGLGSSGSFTTALIKAVALYYGHDVDVQQTAHHSSLVEMYKLKQATGKQDHYIAAYGGVRGMYFDTSSRVTVDPASMSRETLYNLEDRLLLFFTGVQRSANDVLQDRPLNPDDRTMGREVYRLLESGQIDTFAELLNVQAERKKDRVPPQIEEWRQLGIKHGAIGGKLVGAGGGGFLMFYTKDQGRLRRAMAEAGLEEVRFRFEFEGTKVLVS